MPTAYALARQWVYNMGSMYRDHYRATAAARKPEQMTLKWAWEMFTKYDADLDACSKRRCKKTLGAVAYRRAFAAGFKGGWEGAEDVC